MVKTSNSQNMAKQAMAGQYGTENKHSESGTGKLERKPE
jgi:hypothetical protein